MKKYSLKWWFQFGKQSKLWDGYSRRNPAKSKLAKLAYKIGQIAA